MAHTDPHRLILLWFVSDLYLWYVLMSKTKEDTRGDKRMSRKQQLKKASEQQKKLKRYLRKKGLRERYGDVCEKTIDRYRGLGRIPPPDFYQGAIPYWSEDRLDAADRKAMKDSLRVP